MIGNNKVLAVIPARGGSKRLPEKNVLPLGGQPLIAWTINAALNSPEVDRLIVSTDSPQIQQVSLAFGAEVPFIRPKELSGDHTPGVDPILHAVQSISGYDIVLWLQATSPFRTSTDISQALHLMCRPDADAVLSVTAVESHPNWMKRINSDGWLEGLTKDAIVTRSQDLPPVYCLNGAIYGAKTDRLLFMRTFHMPHTVGYVMPHDRSLDIDTEEDLLLAEWQLSRPSNRPGNP